MDGLGKIETTFSKSIDKEFKLFSSKGVWTPWFTEPALLELLFNFICPIVYEEDPPRPNAFPPDEVMIFCENVDFTFKLIVKNVINVIAILCLIHYVY